jgi:hypothetical protein
MKAVEFKCDIGEKVYIRGCDNTPGHIDEMCWCRHGDMYRVIWWADGKRYDEWMFSREIGSANDAG